MLSSLDAGVEQRREHVGVAVAQDHADQRREAVRVPHLRRAPAVPLEGALDVVGHRRVVALDDDDLAARAATSAIAAASPPIPAPTTTAPCAPPPGDSARGR